MNPAALPWLGAAALLAGLAVYASAFGRLRLWRKVRDTPTARLRSAALGQVELHGLAAPLGAALRAPFSGSACVWWKATVERLERDHKGHRRWQNIHQEQSAALFQLRDPAASVTVDPEGAELDAPRLFDRRSHSFSLGAGSLSGLAGGLSGLFGGGDYRYREWRLDVDRPLYVLGVLRGTQQGPLLGQGRMGEPYLISHHDEKTLLGRLGLSVGLRLAGGSVLVFLGVWLLLGAKHPF